MKPKRRVRKKYERREPNYDFLKYWRVVRLWAQAKYGISFPELELMMYLYGEELFTYNQFTEYAKTISWDKRRFKKMKDEGWISTWRETNRNQKALYEISLKGKAMVRIVYKKLTGEQTISESGNHNPIFKASATHSQKRLRPLIGQLNKETTA